MKVSFWKIGLVSGVSVNEVGTFPTFTTASQGLINLYRIKNNCNRIEVGRDEKRFSKPP
jgi:hypothetical protein